MQVDRRPVAAHIIDGLGSGGAEALLVTNLRWLRDGPFRHIVVTLFEEQSPAYPGPHFWAEAVRGLGIPLLKIDVRGKAGLPAGLVRLANVLRSHGASIVHTHLLWAGLLGRAAAKLLGIPVVSSLHLQNYEPEVLRSYSSPNSSKHELMRLLEARSLATADAVIAVGESVAESATRRLGLQQSPIEVILNPVDFEALDRSGGRPPEELRASIGATANAPLLLNVGRVVAQKDQLGLVQAAAPVLKAHPAVHLVLLGALTDVSYVARVRESIAACGVQDRVHLLGVTEEVGAWLRAARAFVFPSSYEGLPVALIEAAGLGCLCIASDISPNKEVIENEKSGLLVGVANAGALSSAIERALGDPTTATLGATAKQAARSRFSAQASARALTAMYVRLAERAHS